MKKSMVLTVAFLFALMAGGHIGVNAQNPQRQSPEERAKMQTDWMKSTLNLSTDQVAKVDTINLKYAKKMSAMFQQSQGGDPDARRKMREDMDTQKRADLAKILTADQLNLYDKALADRRANRPGPPR